jgi:hypothetical protein
VTEARGSAMGRKMQGKLCNIVGADVDLSMSTADPLVKILPSSNSPLSQTSRRTIFAIRDCYV